MKNQNRNILVSIVVALSAVGCQTTASSPDAGTPFTDEEVTSLISGNTIIATNSKGKKYRMFFDENGGLENSAGEVGNWEVVDGAICNTYQKRGSAGCDKVFRDESGGVYYVVPNGKTGTIESIEVGNSVATN